MLLFIFKPYLFFAALFFILPLEKRKAWIVRFFAGLGSVILLTYTLVYAYLPHVSVSADNIGQAYQYLQRDFHMYLRVILSVRAIELVMLFLLILFCCRISLWESLYATVCAYTMRQIAASIIMLLLFSERDTSFKTTYQSWGNLWEVGVYAVVYLVCYFLVARRLAQKGHYDIDFGMAMLSVTVVLIGCLWLSIVSEGIYQLDESPQYVVSQLFLLLCCIFVLWVQVYQKEITNLKVSVATERLLRQQQKDQYKISKENMELIQIKIHDFKHQVEALRAASSTDKWERSLEKIEESMDAFSATSQTGNEVLDVVLTQKSLVCLKKHIKYTFMADGALLSFMEPMDIFALFGNALDNAIENVDKLQDNDKKVIALILRRKGNMVFLQFENYFDQPLLEKGRLFESSKPDKMFHGFGLKSMEHLAERYGGSMQISTQEHIFMVSFLFPMQIL